MIIIEYILPFILILSFIVFIHEFGHYIVAKKFGVKIEEFSIGFGKELYSYNDKSGTRWKICLIPLGGYVKMFGDRNAASMPEDKKKITQNKDQAFIFKPLYQKFLIVLAGPGFNYILSIIILFFIFLKFGISSSSNIITEVKKDSPAFQVGILAGDMITEVSGIKINKFQDIQKIVQISPNIALDFKVSRNEKIYNFTVTPEELVTKDFLDNEIKTGLIGITSDKIIYEQVNLFQAAYLSVIEVWDMTILSVKVVKQLILGQRDLSDLAGPIKIAKYSGQVTEKSLTKNEDGQRNFYLIFWFIAIISVNLGFANLLPIPVLDGGHLMLYIIQAIRGKELSAKIEALIFKLGFTILILLFIAVTINDVKFIFIN
jgi:regulator of sigma E protease